MLQLTQVSTKAGIYKITSPSGSVYVGQATNLRRRLRMYINFYEASIKPQRKLYNSFTKYGVNNHQFEIIEYCDTQLLGDREAFHKSEIVESAGWSKCLFCKVHDAKAGPKSPDTTQRMSESHKGKKHSKQTKNKMSQSAKDRGFSVEHRLKITKALKGREAKNKRPVNQYDSLGTLVGTYSSICEAKQKTGINPNQCVSGHTKSAGGFFWKYC
jgi:group I intron endonuclease